MLAQASQLSLPLSNGFTPSLTVSNKTVIHRRVTVPNYALFLLHLACACGLARDSKRSLLRAIRSSRKRHFGMDLEVAEEWMEGEYRGCGCEPGFVEEGGGEAKRDGKRRDAGPVLVDSTRLE